MGLDDNKSFEQGAVQCSGKLKWQQQHCPNPKGVKCSYGRPQWTEDPKNDQKSSIQTRCGVTPSTAASPLRKDLPVTNLGRIKIKFAHLDKDREPFSHIPWVTLKYSKGFWVAPGHQPTTVAQSKHRIKRTGGNGGRGTLFVWPSVSGILRFRIQHLHRCIVQSSETFYIAWCVTTGKSKAFPKLPAWGKSINHTHMNLNYKMLAKTNTDSRMFESSHTDKSKGPNH